MNHSEGKNIDLGTIDLWEYLGILLKRKWIFLLCFIIPVTFATVYSFSKKNVYRATAILEVDTGFNMPLKDVYQESSRAYNRITNQIEILKGNAINKRVSEKLSAWEEIIPEKYIGPAVDVTHIRGTSMIEIQVDSPYKEYAKAYTEALTREFLNFKKEQKDNSSEFALLSLTKEINKLNDRLNKAQITLQEFRENNEEIMVEEYGKNSPRQLVALTAKISDLETEKTLIEKQIKALEGSEDPAFWISVVDDMQQGAVMPALQKENQAGQNNLADSQGKGRDRGESGGVEPLPFIFVLEKGQSKRWQELKTDYKSMKSEHARIVNVYKPSHPERIRLENSLEEVGREMKAEVASLLETFKAKREGIQLEEDALKKSLEKWKQSTLTSSAKINQLETLKDEVKRLQKLYDVLIKRVDEIQVSTDFGLESVSVIEAPRVLRDPVGPKRARNILMAVIFGLGLGCSMVFFLEYLDDSIKSTDELKEYTGITALGVVHSIDWDQKNLISHNVSSLNDNAAVESYRSIRTNILLSSPEKALRTVLITSAVPSEGKTTVSVNTATVLAQSGLKVLLIDGDMRRPTVHKMFGCENKNGLSSVLLGQESLENCVQKINVDGIDFLPAGTIVPDPPKLLHYAQMNELLEHAIKIYDKIIIDSAPVLTVTDSVILSDWVDGIMFVVHGASTSRIAVKKARETLLDNSDKLIGAVINNLPLKKSNHYYSYYGYKYKYGYKYGYGNKPSRRRSKKAGKKKEEVKV